MLAKIKFVILIAMIAALLPSIVAAQAQSLTLNMAPQNSSGQDGTATLTTGADGKTTVVLNLKVGPAGAGVAQPAHIHVGGCPGVGAVKYPLTNVVDGKSTTVVDVSIATLLASPFAINVHKSGAESGVYTSCADVKAASRLPTTGGESPMTMVIVLAVVAVSLFGVAFGLKRANKDQV